MARAETLFLYPRSVRAEVLAQHQELRGVLEEALAQTGRSSRGQHELTRLAITVLQLRRRFRAHLAYEERKLFPVLARADVWGPERVAELTLEHARQRSQLDTLVEGMKEGWDVERVAITLRSLATDLLLDMEEEERTCLDQTLLGDEVVSVVARP